MGPIRRGSRPVHRSARRRRGAAGGRRADPGRHRRSRDQPRRFDGSGGGCAAAGACHAGQDSRRRPELPRSHPRAGDRTSRDAPPVREVPDVGGRPRGGDPLDRRAHRAGRLRGRAGGRHRAPGHAGRRRNGHGARLRLHRRKRCVRTGPAVRRRAVDARQGARPVPTARSCDRRGRRAAGSRLDAGDAPRIGRLDDVVLPVAADRIHDVIAGRGMEPAGSELPVADLRLLAPVSPSKVLAVGQD